MISEIKGWHVASAFVLSFGVIIAVNLTLAFNAVRTFPGLEVKNSYVASQSFDANRKAQTRLGWDAAARLEGNDLLLSITENGVPIAPEITRAIFGRATTVAQDQTPAFVFDGTYLRAPVIATSGNWNLRIEAKADDGTLFQQRMIVEGAS